MYLKIENSEGRNNVQFQKKAFDHIGIMNRTYSQWPSGQIVG